MTTAEALEMLTSELIESHGRCHYPYVLTSGPCNLQGPAGAKAGVFIAIDSEVFGRIVSASAESWEAAILQVCEALNQTRERRSTAETKRRR